MHNILLILPLCFFFLTGCQTMGKNLNNEHTKTHNIDVEVVGKSKRFSKNINVRHRLKNEDVSLMVFGDIQRPMGALISLVKIKARFMDDKGQVIREEDKNGYFRNSGTHASRKYTGSYYVEIPDDSNIVKCEVEFI